MGLSVLGVLVLVQAGAATQSDKFVGTWQVQKSSLTGRSNLTVNIIATGDVLNGTVVFVNPDTTSFQVPISNTKIEGNVLSFETVDHDTIMRWSLEVAANSRRGVLKGSAGHMLIEEKVKKKG